MVEESDLKQWKDAGHVARRTLEGIEGEIVAGKSWNEVIDSAERFIRRHGARQPFRLPFQLTTSRHITLPTANRPRQRDGMMRWFSRRAT